MQGQFTFKKEGEEYPRLFVPMVSFILCPSENRELNISDAVTFNPQVLRPRKYVAL